MGFWTIYDRILLCKTTTHAYKTYESFPVAFEISLGSVFDKYFGNVK